MKSQKSVVRVVVEIDTDRADRIKALAKLRGMTESELIQFFLINGLNHPRHK